MTPQEMRAVADDAAEKAVRRMLLTLGVDTEAEGAVLAVQADFAFIRRQREAAVAMRRHAVTAVFTMLTTAGIGLGAWFWTALRSSH